MYEPRRDRGSRDVSARWTVTIWSFVSGNRRDARWERKSDLPDDGGEVMSVGMRREVWSANVRRALMAEGVDTTTVEGGGDGDGADLNIKTP